MSRNLKSLGLALMGLLALTAVAASSASATNLTSTSGSGTTYLTGVSTNVNQLDLENGANVKCTSSVYKGSFAGTSISEPVLSPTYTGCTSSGQQSTINTTGCDIKLETATKLATHSFDGKAELTGCSITVAVGDPTVVCHVTAHPQTMGGVIDYAITTGPPKDITLTSTLKVNYTATGSVCGSNGSGSLTGTLTARAYSNSTHTSQVDLWLE